MLKSVTFDKFNVSLQKKKSIKLFQKINNITDPKFWMMVLIVRISGSYLKMIVSSSIKN